MNQRDDELERELRAWLEAEARLMPAELRAAVQRVAERHSQLGQLSWLYRSRLTLFAVAVTTAVVLVVAVVLGASFLQDLRQAIGDPIASTAPSSQPAATQTPSVEAQPSGYEWDAMLNFIDRNPSPDGYGHTAVWAYLSGPAGLHDPNQYEPLPEVEAGEWTRWSDPAFDGLDIALPLGTGRLEIHPAGGGADGRAAIVSWRSPVGPMPIRAIGSVEVDGSCGDGIVLVISWQARDQGGDIQTVRLPRGRDTFDIYLDEVIPGWIMYFKVEPGADSRCDTTWLEATVYAPATRDSPPPGDR